MIFLTVGSQKFEFDRLLSGIDSLLYRELIKETVVGQIGHTNYIPENFMYENFVDRKKFQNYMFRSDLVITHGGTGAIVNSLKLNKPVIAIPRMAKYGEHVDDHQKEIVDLFVNKNLIFTTNNLEELPSLIKSCREHKFEKFTSNNHVYIENILKIINSN